MRLSCWCGLTWFARMSTAKSRVMRGFTLDRGQNRAQLATRPRLEPRNRAQLAIRPQLRRILPVRSTQYHIFLATVELRLARSILQAMIERVKAQEKRVVEWREEIGACYEVES